MKRLVEVRKKDNESGESLLRRFNRKVQQSGILIHAKQRRFFETPKNKRAIRDDAIRRSANREKKDYLRKIGKLDDWSTGRQGRPSRRP